MAVAIVVVCKSNSARARSLHVRHLGHAIAVSAKSTVLHTFRIHQAAFASPSQSPTLSIPTVKVRKRRASSYAAGAVYWLPWSSSTKATFTVRSMSAASMSVRSSALPFPHRRSN
jgi:hypothetical protein